MNSSDTALTEFSKLWWGNALRLRCAAWIRDLPEGEEFYQRQIARELSTEAAYVRRELDLLTQAGAIRPQPQEPGQRRQMYVADRPHPIWDVLQAARKCAQAMDLDD